MVGDPAAQARARAVQIQGAARPARRRAGGVDHRRARQGAVGCARLGDARHRGGGVRLRNPPSPQGRVQREHRRRHRLLVAAAAARRVRRHHALQLSGDGAAVDVPGGDGVRQHLRAQAVGARSRPARSGWPSWRTRPGCRPACSNVLHGDKVAVDGLLDPSGRRGGELRRLDADRAARVRDRLGPRQAGAGAGRRQEPPGGDARRRPRPDRGRPDGRRLRLGRRALHGHLGGGGGGRRRRRAGGAAGAAGAGAQDRPGHRAGHGDGAAGDARSTASASRATSTSAWRRARSWWSMGASLADSATASSSAAACSIA